MELSGCENRLPQWALSFLGGFIVGGVAVFAFSPYLLESALGRAVFSHYRVIQGPVTNVDLHEGALAEGTKEVTTPTKSGLSPRASTVSADYAAKGEAALVSFNELQTLNAEVGSKLVVLNEQVLKGDYTGITDKVAKAKTLIAKGRSLGESFSSSLRTFSDSALGANAEVKNVTGRAVEAGLSVSAANAAYLEALMATLGGVPSQAQIATLTEKTQAYTKAVAMFQTSIASLNSVLEGNAAAQ